MKQKLKIDWATYESAKYACQNWHYSKCLPVGKMLKFGVWENDKFIGVILFSYGATPNLGKPYNLTQQQCVELTRIALTKHINPVSKMLSICLNQLSKQCPGIKLIVSFADPNQNHHGGIYQATNWIYTGKSNDAKFGLLNGKIIHPRTISFYKKNGKIINEFVVKKGKHRYLYPLDRDIKKLVSKLALKYPKRALNIDNDVSDFQSEEGGVIPTNALQILE